MKVHWLNFQVLHGLVLCLRKGFSKLEGNICVVWILSIVSLYSRKLWYNDVNFSTLSVNSSYKPTVASDICLLQGKFVCLIHKNVLDVTDTTST